jgi:hypothetical protein
MRRCARRVERSGGARMTSAGQIRDRRAMGCSYRGPVPNPSRPATTVSASNGALAEAPGAHAWGGPKLRASSHFGPPPVRPHPDTLSPLPSSHAPLAPKRQHAATHTHWGATWASGKAMNRNVGQIRALSARQVVRQKKSQRIHCLQPAECSNQQQCTHACGSTPQAPEKGTKWPW